MTGDDRTAFLSTEIKPSPSAAEPAVLGLTGLAVAALVLASGDLGLASGAAKSLMIPWTLMLGATAQLIAGLIDFKRCNMFGATAFTTYSLLWYAVSLTLFITIYTGAEFDISHYAYGLIGFLVFSLILTVGSMMTNKTLFAVLVFIDLAVLTLVLNVMAKTPAQIVGAFLLCVAASSFYGAAGILLNTMTGRSIIPLGKAIWQPGHRER
jgi:succinate-acetate transporter protein